MRCFPATGRPLMHIVAAKAVCFKEAMEPAFASTSGRSSQTRSAWLRQSPATAFAWSAAAPTIT